MDFEEETPTQQVTKTVILAQLYDVLLSIKPEKVAAIDSYYKDYSGFSLYSLLYNSAYVSLNEYVLQLVYNNTKLKAMHEKLMNKLLFFFTVSQKQEILKTNKYVASVIGNIITSMIINSMVNDKLNENVKHHFLKFSTIGFIDFISDLKSYAPFIGE